MMYDGIRKAVGPTKKLTSPLESATEKILHNIDEQLGRWVQWFSLIYSKQNIVIDATLKHIENLANMDDLNKELTIEELSKVITGMAS